ncbi:beta subunit of fatty acid synthetase, partial [Linderina pennispora]
IGRSGLSFAGKTALVTGCGRGSIGSGILQGLLAGGAKVIATTSSYNRRSLQFFEDLYKQFGARGSELVVVPYNQGSLRDVQALVQYVYSPQGLGWDLDYAVPFAATSEIGKDITGIDSKSELALRIMLTNTLRLLGEIKLAKVAHGHTSSPVLAIVPMSPNHGVFGGDGLYGECKAGLETLFNRWNIESWAEYISVAGAVIGWTRGTNMMDANDMNAYAAEKSGMRSFSTKEMAFNILGLMAAPMAALADTTPVWADFNGGFQLFVDSGSTLVNIRSALIDESAARKAIASASLHDHNVVHQRSVEKVVKKQRAQPLAKHRFENPKVKAYEQLEHLRKLEGLVNLDTVVVATGYGEVGAYGNAETRWEIEAHG